MRTQVVVDLWERMNDSERILICKLMTGTAIKLAQTSAPDLSEAFLELARAWSFLANQISHETARLVGRDSGTNASPTRKAD